MSISSTYFSCFTNSFPKLCFSLLYVSRINFIISSLKLIIFQTFILDTLSLTLTWRDFSGGTAVRMRDPVLTELVASVRKIEIPRNLTSLSGILSILVGLFPFSWPNLDYDARGTRN